MAQHRAFTAVETLLTIGIIAVTAGFTVPMYRNYQIRSDLDLVTEQTIQGLRRAQVLAQSGENDSAWGFNVQDGVLYQGEAYAVRDPQNDETYPVPSTINTSGLPEVSFSRVDGIPDRTGEIIIQGLNGEQRIIIVGVDGVLSTTGIEGGEEAGEGMGGSSSSSAGGDDGGSAGSSSSAGGGDSGGSSSGSSSGGGDDSGGGTGGDSGEPTCEDRFAIGTDGVISTTGNVNATFEVLGSQITYGAGGPEVQVRVYASTNGGTTWVPLFNEADVDGGEKQTILNIPNGSQVLLKVNGRYSWLFNHTYLSNNSDEHIEVLRNGDAPPEYAAFDNQENLAAFLGDIIGEDGTIDIGTYDAVFLVELGNLGTAAADFQDAVVKVTFSQPEGSCASASEPRFKVSFGRVENVGNGDTQAKLYVGEQGMIFGPNEWVPLKDSGSTLLDNFLTEDVPGLAAWRHSGYIRILQHGSHFDGSKEIVDATVTFQNAVIASMENETGQNITENPLDGIVNDGAGGDEVVVAADNLSLLYQTRVTLQDDAILIHWMESAGAGTTG
ncbi:MAG TPA: type II secretion system protein, partial [Candidatus Peribacteraceae bacterium]|nr:type II secretion system protein [Candidatus Peribacteraceae bacterium]